MTTPKKKPKIFNDLVAKVLGRAILKDKILAKKIIEDYLDHLPDFPDGKGLKKRLNESGDLRLQQIAKVVGKPFRTIRDGWMESALDCDREEIELAYGYGADEIMENPCVVFPAIETYLAVYRIDLRG